MGKTLKHAAIIFDLDGTAIPSRIDAMPNEVLVQAIRTGGSSTFFCAATGRSWQHAKAPIQAIGLTAPCVISGGTQIIDPVTEDIMWEVTIPDDSVTAIRSIAAHYDKTIAYVTKLDVTEPMAASDVVPSSPINTMYMFNVQSTELEAVVEALHAIGDVHAALTRSWFTPDVTDLHITHKNATKEHAIAELCTILGVSKEHTTGIGDGHNDIHLFNSVGTKVAMGNAEDALKELADIVIDDIAHDGLATYITNITKGMTYEPRS